MQTSNAKIKVMLIPKFRRATQEIVSKRTNIIMIHHKDKHLASFLLSIHHPRKILIVISLQLLIQMVEKEVVATVKAKLRPLN